MSRDSALTLRMAATLGVVVGIDLCCVLGVAALLRPWVAPLLDGVGDGPAAAVLQWSLLVVPALALFLWAQLRYARRELLAEVDATVVDADSHPELVGRVRRLATQMDAHTPSVALVDSPVANSFAVGGPRSGTVVVSTGLLAALDGDELDAVLAHELAHVQNHDAAVLTLASFLPALANGDYSLRADLGVGDGAGYALGAIALLVLYGLSAPYLPEPVVGFGALVTFVGGLVVTVLLGAVALGLVATPVVFLSRSLSRRREFVADRAGARTVGSSAAMVAALRALDADAAQTRDLRATESVRGMCFLPHGFESLAERTAKTADGERVTISARSHPSTVERIEQLRSVEQSL